MASEPGWELYRSYLGVLREGSLSGAARALGLAQPTVGRHIEALEKSLGLDLFTRSQSGLLPTPAALELRPYAEAMSSSAAALMRAADSQGGVKGTVRISASEVIGAEVLPPIVADLQATYPELRIELALTNRVHDLLLREADIAVRMTRPQQNALLVRRVGVLEVGLYAHRAYLARRGTPQTPSELAKHALIGFDEETPFLRAAASTLPVEWRRHAFMVRSDSDLAQLALIRAGAGIGVCQVALARRDPQLVRVLPDVFSFPLETWVTMHEDLRHSARCKATFDALFDGLQRHAG
ncbi:LysR family transcriptional regulator [Burkholderia dolosa]|uniref:LysR family transcriptional regulator n=1 Tax=Burkholderia dolosa TaxID=152500 RepID=UPI001BA1EBDA|nr:LysR family transcriptional regulator [Burkholderia dolosa]MBR8455942.1 LysR family transcriptional regulator [Burkholderia dolosa]MDN7420666.1 LysR family transcriptional regulator [Burkholderia dolosa]